MDSSELAKIARSEPSAIDYVRLRLSPCVVFTNVDDLYNDLIVARNDVRINPQWKIDEEVDLRHKTFLVDRAFEVQTRFWENMSYMNNMDLGDAQEYADDLSSRTGVAVTAEEYVEAVKYEAVRVFENELCVYQKMDKDESRPRGRRIGVELAKYHSPKNWAERNNVILEEGKLV